MQICEASRRSNAMPRRHREVVPRWCVTLSLLLAVHLRGVTEKGWVSSGWRQQSLGVPARISAKRPRLICKAAGSSESDVYDIVVVGSGIAGLSAAAMLAMYGYRVLICEAHEHPGGAAHGFTRRVKDVGTFRFDSGPSLFSGMSVPSANPLQQVLDSVGETPEWLPYDRWKMYLPGDKLFDVGSGDATAFGRELARASGNAAEAEIWDRLRAANKPLGELIAAVPPIALRADIGAAQTLLPYLGRMDPLSGLAMVMSGISPSAPFSDVLKAGQVPENSLTGWFFDFLAFALQGLPASATQAAGVSFMMREFFAPGAVMDYPKGGSGALVDALLRAVEKRGGELRLRTRVEKLTVDKTGRCTGVELKGGKALEARVAVLCNADVWNTSSKLLPEEWRPKVRGSSLDVEGVPMCPSFMHLHLGFRTEGLDLEAMGVHHITAADLQAPVDATDNLVFISIPSAIDDTAAPKGYATLHAYLPATEPYDAWAGMDRRSDEYKRKKEERAAPLWKAVERVIPDIQSRLVVRMVGTPLTHERFLNRYRGTYGPAYRAGIQSYPSPQTPLRGLWCIGEGSFPGIGVPAVAGNAAGVANTIAPLEMHQRLLERLRKAELL
ncbi:CRTISO, partial [Symbiodinium microadriaticum]